MIGIYGGTFNPVHFGHLRTALEVKELFGLQQLRLIPCRLPAHRQAPDVAAEMRLEMLHLACADMPGFYVDRRELDREGPSYMVDTLASLRAEYPGNCLMLIIGLDAFAGLSAWHQWQRLFDYAHVLVMTRPNCAAPELPAFLRQRLSTERDLLRQQTAGLLFFQGVSALDISATAIRDLIAAGRNPKFLLPDAVISYIRHHQLYLSSEQDSECKQNNS
ncbi:nicotinate-nucleotide adenylyltransferase [Methylomonas rivi]|uniref:Probable nicotinate-nucleotide adenylyltransferase n=1 Tax=Methylomonas rivi TaxID=2952226 RepID=A0ABT1U510_9GAMM|nr:nicotinate-nucleotide adenylyltransferase [Methylomonas sp. WSC-6]MCQ8128925.1 nicotinate-nucleotide adenylyltransferase [Methylomonas sp. WSC-6]